MLKVGDRVFVKHYHEYGTIIEHVENITFGLMTRVLLEEDWMGVKEIWTYSHKISKLSTLCA